MKHLAALLYGNKFLILFPFVRHYNLEIFLRSGYDASYGTTDAFKVYDFSEKFPLLNGTDSCRHRAILAQAYGLADALLWLHRDLKIFGRADSYLAHNDLKPENILIDGDPTDPATPAGRWKLTDFGISTFRKSNNSPVDEMPSLRDLTTRVTTDPRPRRGQGPYQPPEVYLEKAKSAKFIFSSDVSNVDGRKCDTWSFACIMCDLLAFALKKGLGVAEMRKARFGGENNHFFSQDPLPISAGTRITAHNTQVNKGLLEWLEDFRNPPTPRWVPGYLRIVECTLIPCPEDRVKGLKFITRSLSDLSNLIGDEEPGAGQLQTTDGQDFTIHIQPPDNESQQDWRGPPNDGATTMRKSQPSPIGFVDHSHVSLENAPLQGQPTTDPNTHKHSVSLPSSTHGPPSPEIQNSGRSSGMYGTSGAPSETIFTTSHNGIDETSGHSHDHQDVSSSATPATKFQSNRKFSLKSQKRFAERMDSIKALALDPRSNRVAVLVCQQHESRVQVMSTRGNNPTNENRLLSAPIQNPSLHLAYPHLAIFGNAHNEKQVSLSLMAIFSPLSLREYFPTLKFRIDWKRRGGNLPKMK